MSEQTEKPLSFGRNSFLDEAQRNTFDNAKPVAPGSERLECSLPVFEEKNIEKVEYRKEGVNKLQNLESHESFDIIELPRTFSQEERDLMSHTNKETKGTDVEVAEVLTQGKSLDPNRYATKKTIAQGMLDIALLTANASQLKYILQVGKRHEFYTLMLTLICLSIGLQIVQGLICVLLGSGYNINKQKDHKSANLWNNIVLAMMMLTVALNVGISVFEMREYSEDDPIKPKIIR